MGVNPEWVEAGARAIGEHRPGYGWERDDDTWRHYQQIMEWALAAVEPLIRADERERIAVWPNTRAFIEDEVRTQIAADIEAGCVHGRLVTRDMQDVLVSAPPEVCYRCESAAQIARGKS